MRTLCIPEIPHVTRSQLLQREGAVLYLDGVNSQLGAGAMLGSYAERATRLTERYEAALERRERVTR